MGCQSGGFGMIWGPSRRCEDDGYKRDNMGGDNGTTWGPSGGYGDDVGMTGMTGTTGMTQGPWGQQNH